VAVRLSISDAPHGPIGAAPGRRDNALDDHAGESFKFGMAGFDSLGQRLFQIRALHRLAAGKIFAFRPKNQFVSDASCRFGPFYVDFRWRPKPAQYAPA